MAEIFQRAEQFLSINNICHDVMWGDLKKLVLRPTVRAGLLGGALGHGPKAWGGTMHFFKTYQGKDNGIWGRRQGDGSGGRGDCDSIS